jgi:hypothetical protein
MTFDEGQAFALQGAAFGDVYPALYSHADRELFRAWWLREPRGPASRRSHPSANEHPPPAMTAAAAKDLGYTGDVCMACGGCRMRRNGACLLCEDCKNSSGCS